VKPDHGGSYSVFKEIASESLGIEAGDETALVPLSEILSRLNDIYTREISLFEVTAERIQQQDNYFRELHDALGTFSDRLREMASIPESTIRLFQCVPLEDLIFRTKPISEAHHRFVAEHQEHSRLNERRGMGIFEFMLSHYMQESSQFRSFNRGLRARILSYAGKSMESLYSIWESNELGRVWTFPGANLPRNA
jgi:hypothetical protein